MAPSLLLSSAPPRFHLTTTTPGARAHHLSLTSARSARGFRSNSISIRCEQGAKAGGGGGGLDVWLSRGAMLGFTAAITVEVTTGKGVLQNLGLIAPLPTVALALTGVVGVVTAFLIFQSASQD